MPTAAAAPDPLLALVEQHVPKALCRNGRADQLKLLGLLQHLRGLEYPDERLRLVFHGVDSSAVLNPWAIVYSRVRSVDALERHLGHLDAVNAKQRAAERRSSAPRMCLEHGLHVVEELSLPGVPKCLECDRVDRTEAAQVRQVPSTDGLGVQADQGELEELPPELAAHALAQAREGTRLRSPSTLGAAAVSAASPFRPGQVLADLADLEAVRDTQWSTEHCGTCYPEGRYEVELRQLEGGAVDPVRVACRNCHW